MQMQVTRADYYRAIFNMKASAYNAVWYGLYVGRATAALIDARAAIYPEVRRDFLIQARCAAASARIELRDLIESAK